MTKMQAMVASWKKRQEQEHGNMFIFMFGLFLVMVLVVGVAIDTAGTVASRQGTQNALTNATVAAASQVNNHQGRIVKADAQAIAYDLYGKNRMNTPMTRCLTQADANKVGGVLRKVNNCGFVVTEFSVTNSGARGTSAVRMSTYECSPNTFMEMAIEETCYHITSTSRIASSTERL